MAGYLTAVGATNGTATDKLVAALEGMRTVIQAKDIVQEQRLPG
ncbi:MAG: hypothetical protein ACLSBD_04975 [Blautia massiliensis (ex Durand et al. 2017)]